MAVIVVSVGHTLPGSGKDRVQEQSLMRTSSRDDRNGQSGQRRLSPGPRKFILTTGRIYVVEESPPEHSYEVFLNLVSTPERDGSRPSGLLFSRRHRDMVKERYGLDFVQIYWLATRAGENVVAPTNLGILTNTILKFIEERKYAVILLDGIEYLVSNNDFIRVLRMIDQVNDQVSQSTARLILPVDPRAFERKELALLERSAVRLEKAQKP